MKFNQKSPIARKEGNYVMKKNKGLISFLLIMLMTVNLISFNVFAEINLNQTNVSPTIDILSSIDTVVQAGEDIDKVSTDTTIYGYDNKTLRVKYTGIDKDTGKITKFTRSTLLRFDISGLIVDDDTGKIEIKLQLTKAPENSFAVCDINKINSTIDNIKWTEDTITWNKVPRDSRTFLTEATGANIKGDIFTVDVTEAVLDAKQKGETEISFELSMSREANENQLTFHSSRATTAGIIKPSLSITKKSDIEAQKQIYKEMRAKWFNRLTGNNVTPAQAQDEDYKTEMINIATNAKKVWDSMTKLTDGLTNETRTALWVGEDFDKLASGAKATAFFKNLAIMATAYSASNSTLHHNPDLKKDILEGLDWMYLKLYNTSVTLPPPTNWWDWDIGAPQALCNVLILMYEDLTQEQITNQVKALNYFNPNPIRVPGQNIDMTGANLFDTTLVCLLKGIISESDIAISQSQEAISRVFPYVTTGDGFYTDGSFIQHKNLPYAGGYGGVLMGALDKLLFVLNETPWEVTDPALNNIYDWMLDAFKPLYYKGAIMDMVSGRGVSRFGGSDHTKGKGVLSSMLQLSYSAPEEKGAEIRSFIKENIKSDIVCQDYYKNMIISHMFSVKNLLADDSIVPTGDLNLHKVYGAMDRVVHHRDGYSVGYGMSSRRISAFEFGNKENKKGYNTGMGMTYLYNADNFQYSENYWPTVDMFRLSGITTDKSTVTLRDFGNYVSNKDWVGGSSIDNLYGATGMEFKVETSTLTGKKSWFSFDDEIVAIGSGINSSDNKLAETIVDNRKIKDSGDNEFSINGETKVSSLGSTEKIENAKWAFLGGNVGTDSIGYYFPKDTSITALREARTGNWKEINDGGPSTPITKNYLSMAIEHGNNPVNEKYSYVILPNKTSDQTKAYSENPDITILADTENIHAVKENKLGLIGLNFWNASSVAGIKSNAPASVMLKINADTVEVSISDPTQKGSTVELELSIPTTGIISKDNTVTVNTLGTKTNISVNVANSVGSSHKIILSRDKNAAVEIVDITNPDTIFVNSGIEAVNLPLPQKVNVIAGDTSIHEVEVKWENSNYDKDNSGIYEFVGILTIPQGLSNPKGIVAKALVQVGSASLKESIKAKAENDFFVQGNGENCNWGYLELKTVNAPTSLTSFDRKSIIKFDISSISPNTQEAVIELTVKGKPTLGKSEDAGIYRIKTEKKDNFNEDWDINTLNFSDIERIGNKLQTFKIKSLKDGDKLNLDVTQAVKDAINENKQSIAFELSLLTLDNITSISFHSANADNPNPPTLSWAKGTIIGAVEINSITNPDAISVGYSTTESQLPLVKSVITTLANGSTLEVPVTWKISDDKPYDGNTLGEYIFEGTLNLPSGILNTADHKITTTVNVTANEVSEVINPENQTTEYGTTKDKLEFPQTVSVKLKNNNIFEVPVSWLEASEPAYDGNILGEYIFTGVLNPPAEISNPDGKVATIKINVVNYTLVESSTITTDDAFVQGNGLYTGLNSYLETRTTETTNSSNPTQYDRKSVINFDISQIPEDVDEAFLELRVRSKSAGNKLTTCDLYRIDANWTSENENATDLIKYKNIKRIGSTPISSFDIKNVNDNSDIKLDITEAVRAAKAENKTKVAFELIIPGNADIGSINFHSKNFALADGKAPTLSWFAPVKIASEITKITELESQIVKYGTDINELKLPTAIIAELDNNETTEISVNWEEDSDPEYNGNKIGEYIFKATLNLPNNILNTANHRVSIKIIVADEIVKIINPSPQIVKYGTAINELKLPEMIIAESKNGSNYQIPVDWSENSQPEFDSNKVGKYVFEGKLNISEDILNNITDKVFIEIIITQKGKEEFEQIIFDAQKVLDNPNSTTEELIRAMSDLSEAMLNFEKQQHALQK